MRTTIKYFKLSKFRLQKSRQIALFLGLFVFTSSYLIGQQDNKFKAGIKAGLNSSQITGDGYAGFNKLNLQGGFLLQKPINETSQLQFEILYIQKGSFDPGDPDNGNYQTYRIHLDYIEVPFLYQYEWDKFTIEIGPGVGVLFNTAEESSAGAVNPSGFKWRSFEIDAMLGANYFFNDNVFANVRIHQSIVSTVSTRIITPYGSFGGAYNIVVGASINYVF